MANKLKKKNTGIKLVKKANKLVESRYKFDIWETRVFLSVLAQINRGDEDFHVYRIWYKDVIKAFGLRSAQSYEFLREAAKGLMRKVFYVTNFDNGHRRETEYHIIRSVNYLAEGEKSSDNQEYIDLTIDPEMKPLLLQLGNNYKGGKGEDFTAYDLQNVVKLGAYHVRIYELLKQYQRIGHRKLDVDEVKRMLEITTEYPLFGNFFQKVIKPSVKAINKHTDLNITKLEKIKRGRKVVALYFEFSSKQEPKLAISNKDNIGQARTNSKASAPTDKDELFNKFFGDVVKRFGVTPSVFIRLLDQYNEQMISQAIRITNRAKFLQQIKSNIAGFFIKALKEGYTDTKEETNKVKVQSKLEALNQEKFEKINEKIKFIVSENPEITDIAITQLKISDMESVIIEEKEKQLGRPLDVEDFREDRVLREAVKRRIMEIEKSRFTGILKEYEEKLKKLQQSI